MGERRYDLDWVRIGAFIMLIFYHVGMYYVTWDWHVKSPNASHAIEPLMLLTNPWRLSLLFLISGAHVSFTVVIIDDEPPARAKLVRFVAELADFRVAAEAGTVEDGIAAVKNFTPDLLFLDIQLGNHSGFEILDGLRDVPAPLVVFTTAYSEYAVKAFELQALDYLLKPFDRDRFTRSIERTREALQDPDHSDFEERVRRLLAQIPGRPLGARQILLRESERAFFLSVDDIQRISAAGNYIEVHARGKVHLVRDTLTTFITQLDADEFLRVHRSHVVRIDFIVEMRPLFHGDYELVLRDGQTLSLSRRYKALLPPAIRERL